MLTFGWEVQYPIKGILLQRGQVEHALAMANLKLKPSLFMPALMLKIES